MPDTRADEISMQKHHRGFIQFGGPRPGNPARYAGQDSQYMSITGVSNPESGGIEPQWVPDPNRIGRYRLVGRSVSPADLPSATILLREKHGSIPRQLLKNCRFNVYEVTGKCKDLSDLVRGWTDYVQVYEDGEVTDKDLGDRTGWDSDEAIEDSLSVTFAAIYPLGALGFGEGGTAEVSREVVGVTFASGDTCTNECDYGDQRIYALANASGAASPGLPAEVVYSVNGGQSWSQTNIDGLGATEVVKAIAVAGSFLIVLGTDAAYFSEINLKTGVPGVWTKVTTGLVATKTPADIYVANPREIYLCAAGGYIYKSTDITAGFSVLNAGAATTANLLRITGKGETIVATGATGTVVKSANRGATWAVVSASPEAAASIQAVELIDDDLFWVGSSTGKLYYTTNGGESWLQKALPGASGGQVYDIKFATRSVGYVAYATATPTARIYQTFDGGEDWGYGAPRILNMPTYNKAGRIAIPATDDPGYACNTLAIGGLAGDGSDGIILVGVAGKV